MNRSQWIVEKRQMAERRYDTIFSLDYDENWGNIESMHRELIEYFITNLPKGSYVLDAACGTGKYWKIINRYDIKLKGIDQSYEMLKKAIKKHPKNQVEKLGLQELNEKDKYHGIMCMDAMENIFPEDWDIVLDNFYNALKGNGVLYFTVETISKDEKEEAYNMGKDKGLPIIYGEVAHEGGYHYYPEVSSVRYKLLDKGFNIIKEVASQGYYHFVVRKIL